MTLKQWPIPTGFMMLMLIVSSIFSVSGEASFVDHLTYVNPVIHVGSADPAVIKTSDGTYYMYNTFGFTIWSSDDLVAWKNEGSGYPVGSWGVADFWAPEVIEHDDRFYLFYSAERAIGGKRIGVAIGDGPTGPFHDIGHPLFDFGFPVIDAHPFIDDDGRAYLFFAKDQVSSTPGRYESHVYGVELSKDLLSVAGEPILLTRPEQAWERRSGNRLWNEGPYVIKIDGTYYLMVSANFFGGRDYAVGYATSDHPLGPYTKYVGNPILSSGTWHPSVSGPGHHSVVESPDGSELFIVYHVHADPSVGGGDRRVAIDRLGVREDGSLYVSGPTVTRQPLPSGASQLINIAPYAQVRASSTLQGHAPRALIDGEIVLDRLKQSWEWASDPQARDHRLRLEWNNAQRIRFIFVYPSSLEKRQFDNASLHLSDGTIVDDIEFPSVPGAAAIVEIPDDRDISWFELVVDGPGYGGREIGLSQIVVLAYPGGFPVGPEGSLWFSSPRRGVTLGPTEPVKLEMRHVMADTVTIELNDETIFHHHWAPDDLILEAAALQPGRHRLAATVLDSFGKEYRYVSTFDVEHATVEVIPPSWQWNGDVTLVIEGLLPEKDIAGVEVKLVRIIGGMGGDETPIFSGTSIPASLDIRTLDMEDGAYDLTVTIRTRAEVQSDIVRRVVIKNWETIDDPLLPPTESAWFGTFDRTETVDRSAGWEFVTDQPEMYFGDADRMRPASEGTSYMTWHMPELERFAFTFYASPEAVKDLDQSVDISVSEDQVTWTGVPHRLEGGVRSASEVDADMAQPRMIILTGEVHGHASYVRFSMTPTNADFDSIQLGHVVLHGRLVH